MSLGVVQYVLKPFTFATLRDRLVRYAEFRAAAGEASGQDEVDRALATLRAPGPAALPKGLSGPTLERVSTALRDAPDGLTATGVAEAVGISRITARRYLEHLVDSGCAARRPSTGRWGGRSCSTGGPPAPDRHAARANRTTCEASPATASASSTDSATISRPWSSCAQNTARAASGTAQNAVRSTASCTALRDRRRTSLPCEASHTGGSTGRVLFRLRRSGDTAPDVTCPSRTADTVGDGSAGPASGWGETHEAFTAPGGSPAHAH